jgi:hypothetical protein
LLLFCCINSHFSPSSSIHNSLWFSLLLTCFIISSDCGCSIGKYLFEWIFSIVREERNEYDSWESFSKEMTFNESIFFFFVLFPNERAACGRKGQSSTSHKRVENFLITNLIGFLGENDILFSAIFSRWTLTSFADWKLFSLPSKGVLETFFPLF